MTASPAALNRRLILLDLDGTLVDGQHSIRRTFDHIFPAFGYERPTPEAVRKVVGRSLPFAIRDLLGDDAPAERMAEAYKAHFHILRAAPGYDEALYPDVDRMIRRLASRPDVLLGTATGKALRGINWLIDRHGWQGLFATLQGADTAATKPSPEMVLNACAETGVAPSETLVVGDSIYDMQMARAAGAIPIGVSWGYGSRDELLTSGATRIIDQFSELETVLPPLGDDFYEAVAHA